MFEFRNKYVSIIIPFYFKFVVGYNSRAKTSKYFQTTAFTYENGAICVRKIDGVKFLYVIAMQTKTPSIVIARYLKEIQLF